MNPLKRETLSSLDTKVRIVDWFVVMIIDTPARYYYVDRQLNVVELCALLYSGVELYGGLSARPRSADTRRYLLSEL